MAGWLAGWLEVVREWKDGCGGRMADVFMGGGMYMYVWVIAVTGWMNSWIVVSICGVGIKEYITTGLRIHGLIE